MTEKKKMTLYDYATLFAETVNEQFKTESEECGIIMIMSNGDKWSSLVHGKDVALKNMMANVAITDKDLSELMCVGLAAGIKHRVNEEEND